MVQSSFLMHRKYSCTSGAINLQNFLLRLRPDCPIHLHFELHRMALTVKQMCYGV